MVVGLNIDPGRVLRSLYILGYVFSWDGVWKELEFFLNIECIFSSHMFSCMLTRTKLLSKDIIPFIIELIWIRFKSVSAQHIISMEESCSSSNRIVIVLQN